MAIAFVRQNTNTWFTGTAANTMSVNVNNAPTLGNALVALVKTSSSGSVSNVTDVRGNSWGNPLFLDGNVPPGLEIWTCVPTPSTQLLVNDTITVHYSTTMNWVGMITAEFSGMSLYDTNAGQNDYSVVMDASAGNDTSVSGTTSTITTAFSANTGLANELIITGIATANTLTETFTVPTGYTGLSTATANASMHMGYKIVSSIGTYSNTWTWTPNIVNAQSLMCSFYTVDPFTATQTSQSYVVNQDPSVMLPIIGAG